MKDFEDSARASLSLSSLSKLYAAAYPKSDYVETPANGKTVEKDLSQSDLKSVAGPALHSATRDL